MPTAAHKSPAPGEWTPTSWQAKPAAQQPVYPDPEALHRVLGQLARLPPLVTSWEIENLKQQLAEATRGERFLLQGGDCSESFDDCESAAIASKLKILLQMSLVLVQGGKRRVTRIGRFAGQYAKPRSTDTETHDGVWGLGFVANSPHAADYTRMVESIGESLRFMETLTGSVMADINRVDFFTSHEGLHLYYEQAQTRTVPRRPGWYNLSTHFPWIGDRTRALDGAHIEYFRGISNPIGVKVGPSITPDALVALAERLNPQNEPGRLTFIHRFGADLVEKCLPPLAEAIRRSGQQVLWCCDPMHGNTETTKSGIKTRRFEKILGELETSCRVLKACGTHLGGVHFELTGDNVTECIGGASGVTEADLSRDYRSTLNPQPSTKHESLESPSMAQAHGRRRHRPALHQPRRAGPARQSQEERQAGHLHRCLCQPATRRSRAADRRRWVPQRRA